MAQTKVYTVRDPKLDADKIEEAAAALREGKLVIFPTETVYGLGANALDGAAVAGIFRAKGRPQDNPLIVHIADLEELEGLASHVPEQARLLAERFWPGPLTMVLPKADCIPDETSAQLASVGIRMPSNPVARALIRAARVPVAAPSANLSGSPSPTTAAHCVADMDGRVDYILDGGSCAVGVESTVISLATPVPRLLRPGFVTLEQLRETLGEVQADPAILNPLPEGAQAASPGMKYRHYAPKCNVVMVEGSTEAFDRYVRQHTGQGVWALCFEDDAPALGCPVITMGSREDEAAQAKLLFDALRRFDEEGARTVYAHAPGKTGVGLAVYNRLIRAAAFQVVRV